MVKSLILVRELMTGKDSHSIYFANDDLAVEMIDFLKARFHFINEYENESTKKAGMRNWMVYYGANKTPCMISLAPIACKNYKDQAIIYRMEIRENFTGKVITSDMYIDKGVAEKIANTINLHSDALKATTSEAMVIHNEEALKGLENFLISDKDIGEQWEYFSKIKP